ncbi:MAG: hypothetical protein WBA17_00630 [Saprospiraceae bacterium]
MIELLSIHVPKTGGTSFYRSLQDNYGPAVSHSYRRIQVREELRQHGSLLPAQSPEIRVLHGHFFYPEVRDIHLAHRPKVICWLRDPVERVISNYLFFQSRLIDPTINPLQYERNRHRRSEDLLTYARLPENRNRMSLFLQGLPLDQLFFVGFLEHYAADLARLGHLLGWSSIQPVRLNQGSLLPRKAAVVTPSIRRKLARLNRADRRLYDRALTLRPR